VVARDGQTLPVDTLTKIESTAGGSLAVPFAYAVARTADGHSVVVAGTNLEQAQRLNGTWWSVNNWPKASHDALIGTRAASVVGPPGKPFDLSFQGRTIQLNPAGTLQTGAADDSRIYISLANFSEWTQVPVSTVEISASGSSEEISGAIQRLSHALPVADVHAVRQVTEGEANVLGKMRATLLVSAILIILTATVCVLSTLTGWVADRRRDFALMKALGASGRMLQSFFAAEAAALGVVGALIGFIVGIGAAIWIGRANFHAPVTPRLSVLPVILAGGIAVSLLASIVPISLLRRVQPANILRGE